MSENERFDIGKLVRGFNIFNGPALGKLIQQALVVLIILAVVGGLWYKLFGQRTVGEETHQQAKQITNIEKKDAGFRILGIELFGWRN